MSLLNFDGAPFDKNLVGDVQDLLAQPNMNIQEGSGKKKKRSVKKSTKAKKSVKKTTDKKKKTKRTVKRTVKKTVKSTTKKSTKKTTKKTMKKKVLDMWTKEQLEKLAKKHGVSLKGREGKPKTKALLYRSLKRRGLL